MADEAEAENLQENQAWLQVRKSENGCSSFSSQMVLFTNLFTGLFTTPFALVCYIYNWWVYPTDLNTETKAPVPTVKKPPQFPRAALESEFQQQITSS